MSRTDHRRPATSTTLAGTAAWRAVVVACSLIGFVNAIDGRALAGALSELSQQASLAAAIVYAGLLGYPFVTGRRFHEPRSPWWRGAIAVTLLVVMAVYTLLLDTDFSTTSSKFEHIVTPLVVLVDVLVVGRNLLNVSWWSVLTWLALPLAYLAYYNAAGIDAYDIPLHFGDDDFFAYFPALVGGTVLAAAVIVGVGRVRASTAGGAGESRETSSQQFAQHPSEEQSA